MCWGVLMCTKVGEAKVVEEGLMKKRLAIIGSTGSIGTRALDVVRDFPERFDVVALSTNGNVDLLGAQVAEFGVEAFCVAGVESAEAGNGSVAGNGAEGARAFYGQAGLVELVESVEADMLLVATVGFSGLFPTLAGIEKGMDIALANKEVLVVGGELVMGLAREKGVDVLPVDSEHNAVFQCLAGNRMEDVRRVVLTASGGPFRGRSAAELQGVSVAETLAHPTWDMGAKISVDSATMMNKGFEVIEACHLFGLDADQIDVVVHRQSVVHSMVEFVDGSVLAQLGQTDMYLPIQHVLAWPERLPNKFEALDLTRCGSLDFEQPDRASFPCLDYAFEAIGKGGLVPAVLNAANEVAVEAFLAGKVSFTDISGIIRQTMDRMDGAEIAGIVDAFGLEGISPASSRHCVAFGAALRQVDARSREVATEYARVTFEVL